MTERLVERRRRPRDGGFLVRLKETHNTIIYRMQPTVVRLMLALASLISAFIIVTSTLVSNDYKTIDFIMPQQAWAATFFLHWIGTTWRIIDRQKRVGWALAINSFGLFLWIVATIATAIDSSGYPHGMAACISLCVFAAWGLFRTGIAEEPITP